MKKVQYSFSGEQPAPVQRIGELYQVNFDIEEVQVDPELNNPDKEVATSYRSLYARVDSLQYAELVSAIIGTRYDASDVEAIMLNYIQAQEANPLFDPEKKAEYNEEYQQLQDWRAHAKEVAQSLSE